jgi:hypothetical protein
MSFVKVPMASVDRKPFFKVRKSSASTSRWTEVAESCTRFCLSPAQVGPAAATPISSTNRPTKVCLKESNVIIPLSCNASDLNGIN